MLSNTLNTFRRRGHQLSKLTKRKINGYYFTVQPNTSEIVKSQAINVYQGPEYQEVHEFLNKNGFYDIAPKNEERYQSMVNIWQNCVFSTSLKAKYFALLPFFFEDRNTRQAQKKFILKMDLLPESKHFQFTTIMASGIYLPNTRITYFL
jgi:hypothetical protein